MMLRIGNRTFDWVTIGISNIAHRGGVVTLATEWTHTISKNQIGDSLGDNSLAIGASTGF